MKNLLKEYLMNKVLSNLLPFSDFPEVEEAALPKKEKKRKAMVILLILVLCKEA